jgi:HAD superfamily hydrolase (TIGR01509 family)
VAPAATGGCGARQYDATVLRAILFDFNGVLVDDEPLHLRLFQRVLREEGVALAARDYYERYVGLDDRGCFTEVLTRAGARPEAPRVMRLIARKASYYQEAVRRQGYPIFPGAVELVRAAAAHGATLGVVSGALREEVEQALRQEGLRERFKLLVTAEDVAEGKPSPEGYLRAMEELNSRPPLPARLFHPHEVLAVEDTPAGLAAAAAAGLVTLGVAHTYPPEALAAADVVAARLAEIDLDRLQALYAKASSS